MAAAGRKPPETQVVNVEDLLTARQVADRLGLQRARSVSVYWRRYADFPDPIRRRPNMWRRQDVDAWREARGR